MPMQNARDGRADYAVGYGKPPFHTRFAKGRSGNPGGRPRGTFSLMRAKSLALMEAYRRVAVEEAGKVVKIPVIQAVLRSQMTLAAQGNGAAQRAVIAAVLTIEAQEEQEAQLEVERRAREALSVTKDDIEARRVCYLPDSAGDEKDNIARNEEGNIACNEEGNIFALT